MKVEQSNLKKTQKQDEVAKIAEDKTAKARKQQEANQKQLKEKHDYKELKRAEIERQVTQ